MRKIIIYFAALAALLAVSCNSIETIGPKSNGTLTISLNPGEMETKAQTTQESVIDHFDYFFFSDADGTQLITSDRVNGSSKTFNTAEGEEFEELAGTSYFYAIANYPEEIPSSVTTLEDLLELPVNVSITDLPSTPFVMDSYDADADNVLIRLSPSSKDEEREMTVDMRRIAAKFIVKINFAQSAQSAGYTWVPTTGTKDFYMYMVNALDEAYVNGEPIVGAGVEDEDKFYTYPHTHDDLTGSGLNWVSAVSYAYPESFAASDQKAPYFKIQLPWVSVYDATQPAEGANITAMGSHLFYYKAVLPEITEITRNTEYTLNLTIDKVGGTQEDYVVVTDTDLKVSNWLSPSGYFTGYYSARFLDVARPIYYVYGDNSITIPVTSSHPIAVNVTSATKITYNTTTGAEINTNVTDYTVTPDGKASFTLTKELHNDIDDTDTFDYTPITYEVDITHQDGHQPALKHVTIIQYPPIYVYREASNGYAFVNSYAYTSNHGGRYQSNNNGGGISRSNANNNNDLGTMASLTGTGASLNTNGSQYVVTVSVLPENYQPANMGVDAIIGDPRGGTLPNNNLGYGGYGNNGSRVYGVQSSYNATSADAQKVIAPQIRIASSWGATSNFSNYQRPEERCAAYQENGYPAGRWRVPTVAEIDFLIQLSNNGYIPPLFTTDITGTGNSRRFRSYWSNGSTIYAGKPLVDDGNDAPYVQGPGTVNNNGYNVIDGRRFEAHVRCVYDQWYWGDEKFDGNGNKITGDNGTPAERWIGYIF